MTVTLGPPRDPRARGKWGWEQRGGSPGALCLAGVPGHPEGRLQHPQACIRPFCGHSRERGRTSAGRATLRPAHWAWAAGKDRLEVSERLGSNTVTLTKAVAFPPCLLLSELPPARHTEAPPQDGSAGRQTRWTGLPESSAQSLLGSRPGRLGDHPSALGDCGGAPGGPCSLRPPPWGRPRARAASQGSPGLWGPDLASGPAPPLAGVRPGHCDQPDTSLSRRVLPGTGRGGQLMATLREGWPQLWSPGQGHLVGPSSQ